MGKTKAQRKLYKEFMKTWIKLMRLFKRMEKIDSDEAEHMVEVVELR